MKVKKDSHKEEALLMGSGTFKAEELLAATGNRIDKAIAGKLKIEAPVGYAGSTRTT